jgi:propionyl-CoA synthetase
LETVQIASPKYVQDARWKIRNSRSTPSLVATDTRAHFQSTVKPDQDPTMNKNHQDIVHAHSLNDPEAFWMQHARELYWHKEPDQALELGTKTLQDGTSHRTWTWFPGGEISTCYNCVDRHVDAGHGEATAIIWESPVTGKRESYSYADLLDEVQALAGVLRENGVRKGDVVLIYMPMIPAALFAMLAINRLGAVHAVVFGGFAAPALAQRIESAEPVAIMTASCGIEAGKSPIAYRDLVRDAISRSSFKPPTTIIWQRDKLRWHPVVKEEGERNWQRLVKSAKMRGVNASVVPIASDDPVYIIYTSGECHGYLPERAILQPPLASQAC